MSSGSGDSVIGEITVRYWAAARSAAGVASDRIEVQGPISLGEVVRRAAALHPDTRLPAVLRICSVLVGDRPVSTGDPDAVPVEPGSQVEFLPPFAGG
ncbi:MAG TPA: MoaD/ThiS family protein [Nocardioides sp.]|nr:MoaD/ThiS family protein [Nocardioides sp.]